MSRYLINKNPTQSISICIIGFGVKEGNEIDPLKICFFTGSSIFTKQNLLESLDLEGNIISSIHKTTFDGLTSLQNLKLQMNKLTEIFQGMFADLRSLQHLDLSHNSIEIIISGAFDSLKRVHMLDLAYNNLTRLAPFVLNGLTSLSTLFLSKNRYFSFKSIFSCGIFL